MLLWHSFEPDCLNWFWAWNRCLVQNRRFAQNRRWTQTLGDYLKPGHFQKISRCQAQCSFRRGLLQQQYFQFVGLDRSRLPSALQGSNPRTVAGR
jgi:hypothetical protein